MYEPGCDCENCKNLIKVGLAEEQIQNHDEESSTPIRALAGSAGKKAVRQSAVRAFLVRQFCRFFGHSWLYDFSCGRCGKQLPIARFEPED